MKQEEIELVEIKNVDFKNMPNDEEFYFTIDLSGNKKVHRCKWIKDNPTNFKYIILDKSQVFPIEPSSLLKDKEEILEKILNEFGNYSLQKGKFMANSNSVAAYASAFIRNEIPLIGLSLTPVTQQSDAVEHQIESAFEAGIGWQEFLKDDDPKDIDRFTLFKRYQEFLKTK